MHLITILSAGVNGAENGHAEIYERGTATRADYYTDFVGTALVNSGDNVTLDANGGAEIYVDELVTVKVRNSTDTTTIREVVQGDKATALEVISTSFTGTPYGGGGSAVSEPTTQSAVNDLWVTNNGAPDWKVLVGGVATTLQSAVSAFAGLFFNVKDVAYGAVGDGVTDDATAIAAAMTAAQAAGGGTVYLPPGTYRTTATLTVPTKVNILGSGSNATTIANDTAAANTLLYVGATSSYYKGQTLTGIRFTAQQACTGNVIQATNALLTIQHCSVGDQTFVNGHGVNTAASLTRCEINILDSEFFINAVSASAVRGEHPNAVINLVRSIINPPTTMTDAFDMVLMRQGVCLSSTWKLASLFNGDPKCIGVNATVGSVRVIGCTFEATGGALGNTRPVAIHLASLAPGVRFTESGNAFLTPDKVTGLANTDVSDNISLLSARRFEFEFAASIATTVAIDSDNYDSSTIIRTNSINFQFDMGTAIEGHEFTLLVKNDSGGVTTITPGDNTRSAGAGAALADGSTRLYQFRVMRITGFADIKWTLISQTEYV